MAKYKQGIYKPKNPEKYSGDQFNIVYRSSWELRVQKWLDNNENVLEWSSEEHAIPYVSPIDNKIHRYFVDFYAKIKKADGSISTYLIEVKPYAQTVEPEVQKRVSKKYINEVYTWGINSAKWKSAREYCRKNGWEFVILTEKDMFESNK